MRLPRPPSTRPRRDPKRRPGPPAPPPSAAAGSGAAGGEPDAAAAQAEAPEAGFRASSYDLKRGLDVVELPTSLPPDVLERLFKTPKR